MCTHVCAHDVGMSPWERHLPEALEPNTYINCLPFSWRTDKNTERHHSQLIVKWFLWNLWAVAWKPCFDLVVGLTGVWEQNGLNSQVLIPGLMWVSIFGWSIMKQWTYSKVRADSIKHANCRDSCSERGNTCMKNMKETISKSSSQVKSPWSVQAKPGVMIGFPKIIAVPFFLPLIQNAETLLTAVSSWSLRFTLSFWRNLAGTVLACCYCNKHLK